MWQTKGQCGKFIRKGLPRHRVRPHKKWKDMIRIQKFRFNSFEEHCYLLWREDAGDMDSGDTGSGAEKDAEKEAKKPCVVIDPGFDTDEDWEELCGTILLHGLRPVAALLTHSHPDHCYGVHRLCENFDIPVYMNKGEQVTIDALPALCRNVDHAVAEDFSARVVPVEDGDHILVSAEGARVERAKDCGEGSGHERDGGSCLDLQVIFTPGHSAGGVCYLCREIAPEALREGSGEIPSCESGNSKESIPEKKEGKDEDWKVLFSGDTLFAGCIGRSDLPGGDYDALMRSIFTKLLHLPGDIDVLPGHGRSTTIADERMKNPFLLPFNEPYEAD